ncbi:BH3 interacting domain death agonist [Diretmus argenteus]
MDYFKSESGPNTSLVILSFLHQTDCGNLDLQKELQSLGRDLDVTWDINSNGPCIDSLEDGELQTDGHFSSSVGGCFGDILPQVELDFPVNHEEAEALRNVTAELREIGDQLERSIVTQATQNLARKLLNSPLQRWTEHLTSEVEWAVSQSFWPQDLTPERVTVALTLTLVKGVCEQAPRLLRNLFNTALQYISPIMAR